MKGFFKGGAKKFKQNSYKNKLITTSKVTINKIPPKAVYYDFISS